MKRKAVTIILALALCMSLTVPTLAAETKLYRDPFNQGTDALLEINNITSEETSSYEDMYGDGVITIYYTTAPTTVKVLVDAHLFDHGSMLINRDTQEIIQLSSGDGAGFSSLGYEFVPAGSAYILDEGIYESYTTAFPGIVRIVVSSSDESQAVTPTPTPPTPPPPTDDIKVLVNGTALTFDQPPVVVDGRTLVPLRAIFEALGAEVDYEQSTQTVTAVRGNDTVSLTIGSNILTKNGEQITLDVPAQIIGGRTLVPARAIAESFGAEVVWDPATRVVTITE